MALRFGLSDAGFAFNPLISFPVVITALLGGIQPLWGPILGVVPLVLLSEFLQAVSVLVQRPARLVFIIIVDFMPGGLTGWSRTQAWQRRPSLPRGVTGPFIDAWPRCRGRCRCRAASPAPSKTPGRG